MKKNLLLILIFFSIFFVSCSMVCSDYGYNFYIYQLAKIDDNNISLSFYQHVSDCTPEGEQTYRTQIYSFDLENDILTLTKDKTASSKQKITNGYVIENYNIDIFGSNFNSISLIIETHKVTIKKIVTMDEYSNEITSVAIILEKIDSENPESEPVFISEHILDSIYF